MPRKGASAVQVWKQVPVASRTVEVNTKTGFSLTAGSYSVRASSSQRGTVVIGAGSVSGSVSISSVTTTRASQASSSSAGTNVNPQNDALRSQISAATTVGFTREDSSGSSTGATEVWELV